MERESDIEEQELVGAAGELEAEVEVGVEAVVDIEFQVVVQVLVGVTGVVAIIGGRDMFFKWLLN